MSGSQHENLNGIGGGRCGRVRKGGAACSKWNRYFGIMGKGHCAPQPGTRPSSVLEGKVTTDNGLLGAQARNHLYAGLRVIGSLEKRHFTLCYTHMHAIYHIALGSLRTLLAESRHTCQAT